jgi:hypothetical protein
VRPFFHFHSFPASEGELRPEYAEIMRAYAFTVQHLPA